MRLNARRLSIGLIVIALVVSAVPSLNLPGADASAPSTSLVPTGLSLSPVPPKLPAGNGSYPAVVVSVVDAAGKPTAAISPVNVSLTSSIESVGEVTPSVVIPAGDAYAIANFTTTHTAGTTVVTATSTGLTTASTKVTTVVAVGYPTRLLVSAVPSSVPSSSASTGVLILELVDDTGLPAKAIGDIPITLYSSNTNVVSVTSQSVIMSQGQYLAEVDYASGYVPGSATISASAPGFGSGAATVSVLGSPPLSLKLLAQPSVMPACSANVTSCDGRLVVALTDLAGNPTLATRNIQVQIRSSNLAVVDANETVTIQEGNISALSSFTVTATSVGGTTPSTATITASSPGLASSFATVTVANSTYVSPDSCKVSGTCQLAITEGPNPVLANHLAYSSVVVSLESVGGIPAVNDTGPTTVALTSSVTGVGNFTSVKFAIPEGRNWAAVAFTSTYQVGSTTLTASAQNMLPVTTTLETYGSAPAQVVISAISPTLPADGTTHPDLELSLEDAVGSPAVAGTNIQVSVTSSASDVVGVGDAIIPAGQTYTILNVTSGILAGTANVTAMVASFTSGYTSSSVDLSTVIPAPSSIGAVAPNGGTVMFSPGVSGQAPTLAVQLQDSSGNPARARQPMRVAITSSNSTVISKVFSVVIGVGDDYAYVPLEAENPGKTTLTISTPGLATASIAIDFLAYPSSEMLSGGPARIFTNQTAVVSAKVVLDGMPVPDAAVYWEASSGTLTVATVHTNATSPIAANAPQSTTTAVVPVEARALNDTTDAAGSSVVIFHPSTPGSAVITAKVAPAGFPAKTLNFTVTVAAGLASGHTKAKTGIVQELTTFPLLLVPVGGVAGGGAAAFILLRRRKGGGSAEDEFDTSF